MAREKTDLTDALMAFGGGFGKASGPSIPPKAVPQFGNSPQFPSPSSSSSPPIFPITTAPQQRSPRLDTTANLLPSNGFAGAPQKVWSPPLALGSNSPSKGVPNSIPGAQRPKASPSSWGNHPKSPIDSSFQYHQTEFPVESYATPPNDLTGVATRSVKSQGPKRTRSPSFTNDASLEDSAETFAGRLGSQPGFVLEHGRTRAPQRTGPPSSAFQSSHRYEDLDNPVEDVQRSSTNIANFQASRSSRSPPFPSANKAFLGDSKPLQIDNERSSTNISTFQASRSSRSPPFPSTDKVLTRDSQPLQNESGRRVSPPKFGDRANMLDYTSDSHMKQKSSNFSPNIAERIGTRPVNTQVSKRTRSPSHYADEFLQGNSHDSQDNTEREMQAKARRLARFKVELSEPAEDSQNILKQKVSGNRHGQAPVEKIKFAAGQSGEAVGDFMLDSEGPEPPSVIIGVCPDMCPESERKERERKGDLDKYERLDGDRNQTTESIAVKKYNRTAEREVDLIRPMPVLQKTAAYLLDLLDQPYSDSFLGLYNFLWDRMRAIRMDLRMQHIFNRDAISMLEQMIRLHIIAMHELCEYTKGEGFSEGFDAHLNIEQMNKTSVELFQMYDDHRKRGIDIPSEKEFRGYYALLKLDKHPGYKVEPAELSLDLAKMTPEIRQTPEILFARAVARACRTGNFIAFFRLARQATYLQACLMHAHFAKLRTQALASLHSGLQNNQGIPIAHVTKWLGMEGEDIESLLEYHGFTVKEFEESYMVKEGPFLSSNEDYATKCSQLVLLKKSRTVLEDVSSKSSDHVECSPKEVKHIISEKVPKTVPVLKRKSSLDAEMLDFKDNSASIPKFQPVVGMPLAINQQSVPVAATQQKMTVAATRQKMAVATTQQKIPAATNQGLSDRRVSEVSSVPWVVPSSLFTQSPPVTVRSVTGQVTLPNKSLDVNHNPFLEPKPLQPVVETLPIDMSGSTDSLMKNLTPQAVLIKPQENVDTIVPQEVEEESTIDEELEDEEAKMIEQEIEAAKAKLKLILRMWKKRSSKQKKMRDQRQLVANAALNSLSLGPPIRQNRTQLNHVGELNIDRVLRERGERHGKSWSKLNVSEVVTSTLSERNPDAKCLCWKLLLCPQMKNKTHNLVGSWLRSKLMGNGKENDDELAVSAPGLSVWKWFINGSSNSRLCCLSVVRDVERDKSGDAVRSASGVLFQVSDGIPWKLQKTALNDLLMSLPSGQSLPLLILTDMHDEQVQSSSSTIVNELGLRYIDKARISSFSIVHLLGNQQSENLDGFFSKDRLMEGLRWVANQAPLQPFLHCVKTHELVMGYLNYSLELLQRRGELLGPNDCIGAFNAAVDRATEEVASASDMNSGSWPCTEIDLLEEFSDERRATESFLPSACWSESSSIKPILSAIQSCKLPFFADDLSWLSHGSDMGKDIQNKKSELEKCLITYLVNLSKMMEWELATKEASVMLQNGAELELHGRAFRITPRWVVILRRVFNWRLLNLRSGISSVAYVFDKQRDSWLEPYQVVSPLKSRDGEVNVGFSSSTSEGVSKLRLDEDRSPPYALTRLTLDEMIEVGCTPLPFGRNKSEIKMIEPLQLTFSEDDDITEAHTESDNQWYGEIAERDGRTDNHLSTTTSSIVVEKDKTEADRLSKLLEQCNMLQDRIDEQLFIYF